MNYQPQNRRISFVLPVSFSKAEVVFQKVSASFYRITVPVEQSARALQTVSTEGLSAGRWRVYLNWSVGKIRYFNEREIEVV